MAPCITITFQSPVYLPEWHSFCMLHSITFRKQIEGQNVFGCGPVEIVLDEKGSVMRTDGVPNLDTAVPPDSFSGLTITVPNVPAMKRGADLAVAMVKHFEAVGASIENYNEPYNDIFAPEGVTVWGKDTAEAPDSLNHAGVQLLMNMVRNDLSNALGTFMDTEITEDTPEQIKKHINKYMHQLEDRAALEKGTKVETSVVHETWKELYPKFWQRNLLRLYLKCGGKGEYHGETPTWLQKKLGYQFNTAIGSDYTRLTVAVSQADLRLDEVIKECWEADDVCTFVDGLVRDQYDADNPLSVYYNTSVRIPQTYVKTDLHMRPVVSANQINLNITVKRAEESFDQ